MIACTTGAPLSFSGGDGERYTFPLVGSLEGGTLFVPVMVNERGPYLFAIDPDSNHTVLGPRVILEGKLRTAQRSFLRDERHRALPDIRVEVPSFRLGDLAVTRQVFKGTRGNFDRRGRRVDGVIGRDILRDTLVFSIDRDRAIGTLSMVKAFRVAEGARELEFVAPTLASRHFVTADINGTQATMHLDLGSDASQLAVSQWTAAKLESQDIQGTVVNEFGQVDPVTKLTQPARVRVGTIEATLGFIPFEDNLREVGRTVHGALGLDFFQPFDVALHWERSVYYLSPRASESYATRVARWPSSPLARCGNPGCITLRRVDAQLEIEREHVATGASLEILVEAEGKPDAPRLVINLPPHVDRLRGQLGSGFADAVFVVVDASPFPRACPGGQGCIDTLAR